MLTFKVITEYGEIQSNSPSTILDLFMLMEGKALKVVESTAERPIFTNDSKEIQK